MWANSQETADLVTITEEILNGKLHFLCSVNGVMWSMTLKVRLKIKNIDHKDDINWLRPRYVHKYTKYKMCLSIMMVGYIKQHPSNIWSSIHEKVKQHWGWV